MSTIEMITLVAAVLVALVACGAAQDRQFNAAHSATLNERGALVRALLFEKTLDADLSRFAWGDSQVNAEEAALSAQADRVNLALKQAKLRLNAQQSDNNAQAQIGSDRVAARKISDNRVEATGPNNQKSEAQDLGNGRYQVAGDGQRATANGRNGRGQVSAGRERAMGVLSQDSQGKVVGANGNAGGRLGTMRNGVVGGSKQANFTGDNKIQLETRADSRTSFAADTKDAENKESAFTVDQQPQASANGEGTVDVTNDGQARKYVYNANGGTVKVSDRGAERAFNTWECETESEGVSVCRNEAGQTSGKVTVNRQGEAVATNNLGMVVGRGKVIKISDEKYAVDLNQGFAKAQTNAISQYDCYAEVAGSGQQTQKVKIENIKAQVEGTDNADGSKSFSWPSCFNVEADVTIPADVDASRLAFEFVGHVLPLGNLKCMDAGTCKRECYYCNLCEKNKLMDQPLYVGGNLCDLTPSAKKQKLNMRLCPAEDMGKQALCTKFDRSLVGNDYFKYNGSFNAQMRVWQRPANEAAKRTEFFQKLNAPFGRTAMETEFRAALVFQGQIDKPSDNEMLTWYITKDNADQLMSCRRVVVDYTVSNDKLPANAMLDAFVNLNGKAELFSDKPCDEWKAQQNKEFEHYQKQYKDEQAVSGSGSGGSVIDRLGSLLGGGRGSFIRG